MLHLTLPHLPWFAVAYQLPAIFVGLFIRTLVLPPLLRAVLFLPGTLVHELLHGVVGVVFNAKPVSLSLLPKKVGGGQWVLGSVGFSNIRWYNAAAVGLAPLLAPLIALFFAPLDSTWTLSKADFIYWCIAGPIFAMCLPSWVDLCVAARSWFPLGVVFGVLIWHYQAHW